MSRFALLKDLPRRTWRLLTSGSTTLEGLADESRRSVKMQGELLKRTDVVRESVTSLNDETRALREELRSLKRELHDRLLQYHLQLGRFARSVATGEDDVPRLSGRSIPIAASDAVEPVWEGVGGGIEHPDPEGREWIERSTCGVCGHAQLTVVSAWNKLILLPKAPDRTSARYDYAVCHACGVLSAMRRPCGSRYRFLLDNFGEVTAKRGGGREIANRLLNPYPLTDEDRDELRRLAAPGVFVSDHLHIRSTEHLAGLLRDRFENSVHADVIGTLVEPRGARILEVRSRAGTILDALRRNFGARVYAMPIWESQQFLLREVYGIETSDLIDFERFSIPFEGRFDVIICNHMFTHVIDPAAFFAEIRRALTPGGHLYLHNEPDDAEFLDGQQSMLATLNPLHMQAFDQRSLSRALAANGFETVFIKRRNLAHMVLARMTQVVYKPMENQERTRRVDAYQRAFDRAVLGVDPELRPRLAAEWPLAVERSVAAGTVEFDERGQLRLVARQSQS